jgi:hypothetical protein
MPGYVEAALHKFQHPSPTKAKDAPREWTKPIYGATVQYAPEHGTTATLPQHEITKIQQIIGTLLHYAITVDPTMVVALGTIAVNQSKATATTAHTVVKLLNYAATHPDAASRYHASNMVLYLHSDASYLSASKARSRAGGHFFLNNTPSDPKQAPRTQPTRNDPVHTACQIMRNVLACAPEAEIGALFLNGQEALPIRVTRDKLGHTQPVTPMQTDNSTAAGFANNTIKQKRSKAINMRFTGSKTVSANTSSSSIGGPVQKILVTTMPNTIRQVITAACDPHIYSLA